MLRWIIEDDEAHPWNSSVLRGSKKGDEEEEEKQQRISVWAFSSDKNPKSQMRLQGMFLSFSLLFYCISFSFQSQPFFTFPSSHVISFYRSSSLILLSNNNFSNVKLVSTRSIHICIRVLSLQAAHSLYSLYSFKNFRWWLYRKWNPEIYVYTCTFVLVMHSR